MHLLRCLPFILLYSALTAQNGISWSTPVDISPSQFDNMHPRVVTDGAGDPMVIWGNANAKKVYFSRWTGNGFSSPTQLNPPSIPIFAASWAGPDLASWGDTVYVVFKETPEDASGIYVVRSLDGGVNFSAPERVDAIADSISRFPAISTDADGNPLVAFMKFNPGWSNSRYVVARSTDLGLSYGPDQLASKYSGGSVCDCCPATLTHSGNTVALLYRDNLNNLRTSWAGISSDGGNSFPKGLEVDDTNWMINACPASGPDGVIIGDQLYSVFMSGTGGKTLCYRSRSNMSNLEMEITEPLTTVFPGLSIQNYPRIAASGYAAAIVWPQTVNGSSQLAIQFTDNIGNGFPSSFEVLANNNVENADVAFSNDGRIYVVWEDAGSGTVKYKKGTYTISGQKDLTLEPAVVSVFPNPARQTTLQFHSLETEGQIVDFQLYSAQGQGIHSGNGVVINHQLPLNFTGLPSGAYFLRVQINHENYWCPVMLE